MELEIEVVKEELVVEEELFVGMKINGEFL